MHPLGLTPVTVQDVQFPIQLFSEPIGTAGSAVAQVFSMILGAPHSIRFGMDQLTFDQGGGKHQLIQPCAAGCSDGIWAVFHAPTESVEHGAQ